jgi:hypothetical protein
MGRIAIGGFAGAMVMIVLILNNAQGELTQGRFTWITNIITAPIAWFVAPLLPTKFRNPVTWFDGPLISTHNSLVSAHDSSSSSPYGVEVTRGRAINKKVIRRFVRAKLTSQKAQGA